jgi:hypothetical protein
MVTMQTPHKNPMPEEEKKAWCKNCSFSAFFSPSPTASSSSSV